MSAVVSSARSILEGEVRELVRRRGIDPIAEPAVMARLVDEVVTEYQDRSTTSALPPMGDAVVATRSVLDAVAGFGPLQPLLDDPSIEEIWIKVPLMQRFESRSPLRWPPFLPDRPTNARGNSNLYALCTVENPAANGGP